jgi:hypothetical protein
MCDGVRRRRNGVGVLQAEAHLDEGRSGDEVQEHTLERQCDHEYIDQIKPFIGDYDVILSMACGPRSI